MNLPVEPPIAPMLAKLTRELPRSSGTAGVLYEPKWDGFRCIVFRDRDEVVLTSRNQKPFNRYFPELLAPLAAALPDRCVIDGEIVIPDNDRGGLDFDALQQRIHPAASRVQMLAEQTPSAFIAFDVIALGDDDLMSVPFGERRRTLARALRPNDSVHLTPATDDRATGERWFRHFEGAGLDGVIVKALDGAYTPGRRTLLKVKHERTADCAVAGFRIHQHGDGVGSLLLGLHDGDDRLRHVGVCAGFRAAFRRDLLDELQPLTADALDAHPWREWAEARTDASRPGGASRWNAGKDLSFVPVRVERVVEVRFGQLEGGRFRHGVTFGRWRPDRTPESCRYDQLDVATPVDFHALLAESAVDTDR